LPIIHSDLLFNLFGELTHRGAGTLSYVYHIRVFMAI
jgi:hypothetical protein